MYYIVQHACISVKLSKTKIFPGTLPDISASSLFDVILFKERKNLSYSPNYFIQRVS